VPACCPLRTNSSNVRLQFTDILPRCCSDGLQLSQEVEILRRRNAELIEENARLRERLESICAQTFRRENPHCRALTLSPGSAKV